MPIIERNIEINAPTNKVWEILLNRDFIPKWNFSVKEISELEPGKILMKTNVGDYISTRTEIIENEKICMKADHPEFGEYCFILKEKGDMTELSYSVDYKTITKEKIQARSLEILLKEIKKFVEYLEDGGEPDEYDRKQILVKP
ncbi:MAG: SRPBCC domain-containing protein [Promethearchaeota archaeon]